MADQLQQTQDIMPEEFEDRNDEVETRKHERTRKRPI